MILLIVVVSLGQENQPQSGDGETHTTVFLNSAVDEGTQKVDTNTLDAYAIATVS